MATHLQIVHRDADLIQKALNSLESKTGLVGTILSQETDLKSEQANATIELISQGKKFRYRAECKFLVDRKITIAGVKERLNQASGTGLLIAPYLSTELAEYCRSVDLAFIDTAGNAYLKKSGLYIFIQGLKEPNHQIRSKTNTVISSPSAMKIIFSLLCKPQLINASLREIAEAANVALGTVGTTLSALEKRGFLIYPRTKNNRKLTHPSRLLNEMTVNFTHTLLPKLNSYRYSSPDPNWWKSVQLNPGQAVWGGEVAAQRLTKYLKPATQTLYVNKDAMSAVVSSLVKKYRLRPDNDGAIEIREKFWNFIEAGKHSDIAPAVLVYADLMASLDPRNIEVAKQIEESIIGETFNQA